MGFTAIITGIFSIAKAVPVVADFLRDLNDMYIDNQLQKYEQGAENIKAERIAVIMAVNSAKTDAQRKALSSVLHRLNSI